MPCVYRLQTLEWPEILRTVSTMFPVEEWFQSTWLESFLHGKHSTHCPQDLWPFQSLQSIHTWHVAKWIIITYLHKRHTNVYQTLHEISSHMTTRLITSLTLVCMWKLWLSQIQKLQFCMHLTPTIWMNFTVWWYYMYWPLSISCLILQHFSC